MKKKIFLWLLILASSYLEGCDDKVLRNVEHINADFLKKENCNNESFNIFNVNSSTISELISPIGDTLNFNGKLYSDVIYIKMPDTLKMKNYTIVYKKYRRNGFKCGNSNTLYEIYEIVSFAGIK